MSIALQKQLERYVKNLQNTSKNNFCFTILERIRENRYFRKKWNSPPSNTIHCTRIILSLLIKSGDPLKGINWTQGGRWIKVHLPVYYGYEALSRMLSYGIYTCESKLLNKILKVRWPNKQNKYVYLLSCIYVATRQKHCKGLINIFFLLQGMHTFVY